MKMDNAAARDNFVSGLYEQAVKAEKEYILNHLVAEEYAQMHRDAAIHLHDLEGYRYVYNCCTPVLTKVLSPEGFIAESDTCRIMELFEKIKALISNLAVCQTGGIGFANFDGDLSAALDQLKIPCSESNRNVMMEAAALFVKWVNTTRTRYCREPYYLSLNLGLSTTPWGRCVTEAVISAYAAQSMEMTRPNIIFKCKADINVNADAPNHDLFRLALQCTAKKMIPTYLLMDSVVNADCISDRLGIMGCRTRVYQNSNGEEGTVGRGNIAYVSINLPQIALKSSSIEEFLKALEDKALACKNILVARMNQLKSSSKLDFVFENGLWKNAGNIDELVKQGTLSIGFIGLAETVEILTGEKIFRSKTAEDLGYSIIQFLRSCVDRFRGETGFNFSLLATPGEMISGRFAEKDKLNFHHPAIEKEFYTNSFHVEVNSEISLYEKIRIEGRFHALCNGGSISYVEFNDAPLNNTEALADLVSYAAGQGVSYLGFNFPLDICLDCGLHGTFDSCPACGSGNIKRIRRVSGYLEDLNYFTSGKTREVKYRKANGWGQPS